MDEVDVALAGILPRRAAPPAAGDEEQRPDIRLFLGQQIFFDHVAHFERARLRRACGQAELDRDASLILVGEEAAGQAEEEEETEEHTSELQSLMRISYAVFCLKKKKHYDN